MGLWEPSLALDYQIHQIHDSVLQSVVNEFRDEACKPIAVLTLQVDSVLKV